MLCSVSGSSFLLILQGSGGLLEASAVHCAHLVDARTQGTPCTGGTRACGHLLQVYVVGTWIAVGSGSVPADSLAFPLCNGMLSLGLGQCSHTS